MQIKFSLFELVIVVAMWHAWVTRIEERLLGRNFVIMGRVVRYRRVLDWMSAWYGAL